MKTIIAIDPGASGGIAISGKTIGAQGMPDDMELRDIIAELGERAKHLHEVVCYLEQVGGYIAGNPAPGSAMFNFGDGYGYIRGCLAMAHIKTVLVRPQKWQAGIPGIGPKMKSAVRKRALKEHAARLYPNEKVTLKTADALCLLDYAIRVERGDVMPKEVRTSSKAQYKLDCKASIAWVKREGHVIPAKGSAEFLAMVNYWKTQIAAYIFEEA